MKQNLIKIIPFIPLFSVLILLILRPYYLSVGGGDTDFHLIRAREILMNPFYGIYWDYLTYYPVGRALWHPPLFHTVFAFLWYLVGVRFANTIFVFTQIILTVIIASWIGKREYGVMAGFFAGMFSLTVPRVDILTVALPANFIPILATLTIYFLPKDQFKAFLASLIGVWTHSVGLIIFIPLFLVDGARKNWKYILLLLPSVLFWGWYFISFSGQSGVIESAYPLFYIIPTIQIFSLILIGLFGSIGLYFLYKMDNKRFKLIIAYIVIVMVSGYTDISRGFEYAALPLAIMSGLAVSRIYGIIKIKKKFLSNYFILILVLLSFIGISPFFSIVENTNANWDDLNIPINGYAELGDYITSNSNQSEIIWADPSSADKIVWLTGMRVSNGRYGAPKNFVEEHQKINIYTINNTFYINNENNETIKKIDSKYVLF
ncbi:hypothetical protein [uncultured Methanobacterium sp.]|uniref:hypothetical protein n=1 Tax=uncultured Methanobacterium sp. TaxID=176306 RepID=UPI002AA88481|nr:hypothetical protein [uncultured Methanobacterium sp.]